MSNAPLLSMHGIRKEFPGVLALDGVQLSLERGQVLALLGENGAGKSTLMKVLSGVYPHGTYDGQILLNGQEARFRNTREAEAAGVVIIHQELNLVQQLTVAENLFLGREPQRPKGSGIIDRDALYEGAGRLLARLQAEIDPHALVSTLSVGQQQLVEIAKALGQNAQVLIMDEPTSALTNTEVAQLFELVRSLTAQGVGIIFISHKMDEIFALTDAIMVMRDGRYVGTVKTAETSRDQLVAMMVGRELKDLFPKRQITPGEQLLEVKDLRAAHVSKSGAYQIEGITFNVRRGEIIGFAGLMGSGRTELVRALFGAWDSKVEGEVRISGKPVRIRNPQEAINAGLALVTEDRKLSGLVLGMSSGENVSMARLPFLAKFGVVDRSAEAEMVAKLIADLRVKVYGPEQIVGTLSGGNQQKVVLAKWLATNPQVLILDEPTRGIDVGAKAEIYNLIGELAERGLAVIMVSSELPEILGLADRVYVMHEGRLAGELARAEATQERIMNLATGGK